MTDLDAWLQETKEQFEAVGVQAEALRQKTIERMESGEKNAAIRHALDGVRVALSALSLLPLPSPALVILPVVEKAIDGIESLLEG